LIEKILIFVLLTSFLGLYFLRVDRFEFIPLSTNWALLGLTLQTYGILINVDIYNTSETYFLLFAVLGFFGFILGVFFTNYVLEFNAKSEVAALMRNPWRGMRKSDWYYSLFIFLLSIIALIIFLKLIGGSVILNSITDMMIGVNSSEISVSAAEARKAIHYGSTSEYYAPGYFGQFTNTLLPLSFLIFLFVDKTKFYKLVILLIVISGVLAIIGTTATGRRGVIIGFAVFLAIFGSWKANSPKRLTKKYRAILILLIVLAMGFLSTLLGRVESDIFSGFIALYDRIFVSPAIVELKTFHLVVKDSIPTYGLGWLKELSDILPGHEMGYVQEIHHQLGGSEHGASGFGPYNSKLFNFGFYLGIFFSFIWGAIVHAYQIFIVRKSPKSNIWIVFCYSSFLLGFATSPVDLFNQGFVACMIYIFGNWFIRGILKRRDV